jgi:hypothetical protein
MSGGAVKLHGFSAPMKGKENGKSKEKRKRVKET